jgi:nitrite reductase/ring-hydroxylating ferredoxin subunit
MAKHIVARVEEIPPGERKIVEIGGRTIGVFNVNGSYYALRNRCPHQGGPLCQGRVSGFLMATAPGGEYSYTHRGEILRCPWHGWEFNIATGQSWFDPAKTRVRAYEVHIETHTEGTPPPEETGSYLPGPYTAETYEVVVDEKQFVVLEVPGA